MLSDRITTGKLLLDLSPTPYDAYRSWYAVTCDFLIHRLKTDSSNTLALFRSYFNYSDAKSLQIALEKQLLLLEHLYQEPDL